MRKMKTLLTTLLILIVIGCAPSIYRMGYTPEAQSTGGAPGADCTVRITRNNSVPPGGTVIGTMKIGDSGFSTNCGEDDVLSILRREACGIGADVIVLRDIREPDFVSSCYRVTADFVRLAGEPGGAETEESTSSTVEKRTAPDEEYYSDQAVDKRVKRNAELQACLWIVGAVVGFVIGFTLFSPK